jgi:uncharacterized protein (DUF1330 family)
MRNQGSTAGPATKGLVMMKHKNASRRVIVSVAVLVGTTAFLAGFGLAQSIHARQETAPPAYLVVSSKVTNPAAMGAYGAAAGPLAVAAGIEVVAGRPDPAVTVFEGEWPYEEGILIEKFRSMDALKDFWYSEEYQAAKKLREGALDVNFIVAVQGTPAAD